MQNEAVVQTNIENKILTIRNRQVMIDCDLAELYGVETRRLNEQVKRNIERFPEEFCFQLTDKEFNFLMSQNATSSWGGTRKLPYAFTEHGVTMRHLYHIGASLKDLGKKCFAFDTLDSSLIPLILKNV